MKLEKTARRTPPTVQHPDERYDHCYRCCLQMTPEIQREVRGGICPRCGYDQTIIDISEEIATEEQLKDRQAQKELYDLLQMVSNWGKAYRRSVDERGIDWSAPHEFVQELGDMLMPWVARLVQAKYFKRDEVQKIGAVIDHEVEQLFIQLEQSEELMRLSGEWNDEEQEIKDYWEEKTKCIGNVAFLSVEDAAARKKPDSIDDMEKESGKAEKS